MLYRNIYLRKCFLQELCHSFSAINAPVLSACATEIDFQMGIPKLNVFFYGLRNKFFRQIQKRHHMRIVHQEFCNFGILACEILKFFYATGIVQRTAVKDKSAAVPVLIIRNSFLVRKTLYRNGKYIAFFVGYFQFAILR